MQYAGAPITRSARQPICFTRGDGQMFELTLTPLPIGFPLRLKRAGLVPPAPPIRILRDSSGRPQKDAAGQVVTAPDEHSAEHQAAVEEYHLRLAALTVREALVSDNRVRFECDTTPEDTSNVVSRADALLAELDASGWSVGDLVRLCDEVSRMSGLLSEDLSHAEQSFFSPAAPDRSPPAASTT